MKKLLLITALSICSLATAMEETQLIMLGSRQEIEKVLTTQDLRFELFKNDCRLTALAGKLTTPVFITTILEWIAYDQITANKNIQNPITARDIQDAANAILSTRKAAKL